LRRIRFGRKSESLPPFEHPSLFDESVLADIAAVNAEIEQIMHQSTTKIPSPKSLAPVPAVNRCRIICHALNTVTNPSPANAASAAAIWSKLAKTLPNNSMLNRPNSLSNVTSDRSMPAEPAKPSQQNRYHQQ